MGVNRNEIIIQGVKLTHEQFNEAGGYEKFEKLLYDTYKKGTRRKLSIFADGMCGEYAFIGFPLFVGGNSRDGEDGINVPILIEPPKGCEEKATLDFVRDNFGVNQDKCETYVFSYYH